MSLHRPPYSSLPARAASSLASTCRSMAAPLPDNPVNITLSWFDSRDSTIRAPAERLEILKNIEVAIAIPVDRRRFRLWWKNSAAASFPNPFKTLVTPRRSFSLSHFLLTRMLRSVRILVRRRRAGRARLLVTGNNSRRVEAPSTCPTPRSNSSGSLGGCRRHMSTTRSPELYQHRLVLAED
jgi:hypothetical protein